MSDLLIKPIFLVISTWLFLFVIFTGFGLFINRSFGFKIQGTQNMLMSFWIGWAFTIFFLQIWHLVFSVDWRAAILVFIAGLAGLIWNYKGIWYLIRKKFFKNWVFLLLILFTAIWLANNAIQPPLNYDSGLYHLSSVRWITSFPIIPGLGNLHGRLAFNNSYFLYAAILEIGFWTDKSYHIANGLLQMVLFAQIFISCIKLFRNKLKLELYHIFYILLLAPVIKIAGDVNISSPSPDLPVFILGVVLMASLLAFLENSKHNNEKNDYSVFFIAVLAIIAIIIKFSFFIMGLSAVALIIIILLIWKKNNPDINIKKPLIWIIVAGVSGIIPWMIRSVILSGYMIYPVPFGSFPVDWRIPYKDVVFMAKEIHRWAQTSGVNFEVTGRFDWFGPWLIRMFGDLDIVIPLFLVFTGCLLFIIFRIKNKVRSISDRKLWLFLIPPAASIIYWLFTAPDPRFAGSSFWVLGAGFIVLTAGHAKGLKKAAKFYIIIFLFIILSGSLFVIDGEKNFMEKIIKERKVTEAFSELKINKGWILKSGEKGDFGQAPEVELNEFETNSGLIVYVPVKGDQSWDGSIPNTPYPNEFLRLRKENDMRYGFVIEKN